MQERVATCRCGRVQAVQHLPRLTLGMQNVTRRSDVEAVRTEPHLLAVRGGCRKIEVRPAARSEHVPGEIVYVQALHHEDDCIRPLVVEAPPTAEGFKAAPEDIGDSVRRRRS